MYIRIRGTLVAVMLGVSLAGPALAHVAVGGAPILASKDIIDSAVNSVGDMARAAGVPGVTVRSTA